MGMKCLPMHAYALVGATSLCQCNEWLYEWGVIPSFINNGQGWNWAVNLIDIIAQGVFDFGGQLVTAASRTLPIPPSERHTPASSLPRPGMSRARFPRLHHEAMEFLPRSQRINQAAEKGTAPRR